MVGDRLPGVGWANSSLSRGSDWRLGGGGLEWQHEPWLAQGTSALSVWEDVGSYGL